MPFIRVKRVDNNVKVDLNVARIEAFAPNQSNDKNTVLTMAGGETMIVVESAQAVRGAIRRAEAPVKEELSSSTAGE